MTPRGLNMYQVFLMLRTLQQGATLSSVAVASTLSRYARVLVMGELIARTAGRRSRYALTEHGEALLEQLSLFYSKVGEQ